MFWPGPAWLFGPAWPSFWLQAGAGKSLATYVSAESLAAIASEADHFEVINTGLHSQMLATTVAFSNEIIVPVPLEVVIPLLTLQSLQQLALAHNVVDVFGCQREQDILDVIRQHQKTCTCENVVM